MIFSPQQTLDLVYEAGSHTEGPAIGPGGRIYFCDITNTRFSNMEAGAIYAFDPATGTTDLVRSPSGMAAGIKFDAEGNMLTACGADFGGRAVIRTDRHSGRSYIVAGLVDGKRLNSPNDLDIADDGRIYFTDPRYFGHEAVEQACMGVYRIDPDNGVTRIAADVSKPNGIALSPDQTQLYVVDNDNGAIDRFRLGLPLQFGRMQVVVYDLSAEGTLSNKAVFVDYGAREGADGIAFDSAGNLFAAVRDIDRPGVYVYDRGGAEIGYMPTSEKPTNVCLVDTWTDAGPAAMLYITSGRSLYRAAVPFGPPEKRRNW